jgi:cytidine deaminase
MPVLLVPGDYPQKRPQKQDPGKPGKITEGGVRETTLGALLPDSFGPEDLELPRLS